MLPLILTILTGGGLLLTTDIVKAEPSDTKSSDIVLSIEPVLGLYLTNCDASDNSRLILNVELPTPTGKFVSDCQHVSVETNAPGYQLSAKSQSSDGTNNLIYQNPTTVSPLPTIPSTTNPITAPAPLVNNTWGFAVISSGVTLSPPMTNFDSNYSNLSNDTNKFANMPSTSETPIYSTDRLPGLDTFDFYYATRITSAKQAGTYQTTIIYTATANDIPEPAPPCKGEIICFTVNVGTTGVYSIPTSGIVTGASSVHAYNWLVYVDNILTNNCPSGNCSGTSSTTTPGANGIALTGMNNGLHQIKIIPNGEATPGWGNAFGHQGSTTGTANTAANKNKIISLDAPITTMAFAPKTTESAVNASYMFANIFNSCSNLTTPATIADTYKLPNTITNLSSFLAGAHIGNLLLTYPVDLTLLNNWLSNDNRINNLSSFLSATHYWNFELTNPINLSPIANWFNANNSITDLSYFLYDIHDANELLTNPINLSPIANWFNANSSIINLESFLSRTHYINPQLTKPLDLAPLKNWFVNNNGITVLNNFLSEAHYGNQYQLTSPINLAPLAGWFNANTSIWNLEAFLFRAHYNNNQLTDPINFSPLADWFYLNTSIQNIARFLGEVHYANASLTEPIDLTSLNDWFDDDRSFNNVRGFLSGAQNSNVNLELIGQKILPNWIKTMTENLIPIIDINTFGYGDQNSFWRMFGSGWYYLYTDTEEVRFLDNSFLSSLGIPGVNLETYTGRINILPLNVNWQ